MRGYCTGIWDMATNLADCLPTAPREPPRAAMFKNAFQSGFLSILYSIGSKPLQIWDKKVRRARVGRGEAAGWMVVMVAAVVFRPALLPTRVARADGPARPRRSGTDTSSASPTTTSCPL